MKNVSTHKIKTYIRMPTTSTSSDGVIEKWIDDRLVCTITNLHMRSIAIETTDHSLGSSKEWRVKS